MARVSLAIAKTKMILRRGERMGRGFRKLAGAGEQINDSDILDNRSSSSSSSSSSWVPHPRTGIYFPKGQDHVMDDVPDGAACFGQTYWLRNVDGVDRAEEDVSAQV